MAPEDRRPCRRVSFQFNASTPYWFKSLQDPEDRGLAAFRFFGLAERDFSELIREPRLDRLNPSDNELKRHGK
jgi:hypothetical protein